MSKAWEPIARVRAEDDAAKGLLQVIVKPANGAKKEELIRFDPDTGRHLSLRPADTTERSSK